MKSETKQYLTEHISKRISDIEQSQKELVNSGRDFTTGGPIRSEKSELDQLRLNQQLNKISLKNLRQIQELLPTAPINLDLAEDWAEVEINYIADTYKEFILLIPDETSGVKTPEVLMVSPDSPLGQSIRGHKAGDNISFNIENRSINIELLSVS